MLKIALYNYTPQRRLRKASFEEQDLSRRILLFKDGRKTATTWAANMMAQSLRLMDLSDTIIICVPASCQHTYTRRFKRFTKTLCENVTPSMASTTFMSSASATRNISPVRKTYCQISLSTAISSADRKSW